MTLPVPEALAALGDALNARDAHAPATGLRDILDDARATWRHEEIDPDVFGKEVLTAGYDSVERICAVWLHPVKRRGPARDTQ